jgi:hypothetical protein
MNSQELKERLLKMIEGEKAIILNNKPNNSNGYTRACWLDGEECPYGRPEGQFLYRPRHFCYPSREGGCRKIDDNLEELKDLFYPLIMEDLRRVIEARLERATTRLSDQVKSLADGVNDSLIKGLIGLITEWIKENGDGEIVLPDDLDLDNLEPY